MVISMKEVIILAGQDGFRRDALEKEVDSLNRFGRHVELVDVDDLHVIVKGEEDDLKHLAQGIFEEARGRFQVARDIGKAVGVEYK